MSKYPALVAALQAGRTLKVASLVRFDFGSGTMRVWNGGGPLLALDPPLGADAVWDGTGELGKISDIERGPLTTVKGPDLTLSGVDPSLVARTQNAAGDVKGHPVRIFEQYYDGDARVDMPVVLFVGFMDRMRFGQDGPDKRRIMVSTLNPLYRRRRSPFAYLGHATQERLHPGDRGCDQISALVQADPRWPVI